MTPVSGAIDNIVANRWFGDRWLRRGVALILIVVCGILALFPQQYRASVTLAPTDPGSLGLGGALGQTSAFNSVFGSQAALEISLNVGRSQRTRQIVMQKMDLIKRLHFSTEIEADRWLRSNVGVRAMRGGLLQFEVKNRNADLALDLVSTFTDAARQRLGEVARSQTAYKRQILGELIGKADARLIKARADYDAFRLRTSYTAPASAIAGIGSRVPAIRTMLKSREIDLRTARAFATDDNMSVKQIKTDMAALQEQLKEARKSDPNEPYSVDRVVKESTQVARLERELWLAQSQYDAYKLFLEGTFVEDLTSTANMRILEPPVIDTERQFNVLPAAIAILVALIAIMTELYLMRPPLSAVRTRGAD